MDDEAEDVTELNLQVETGAATFVPPADEEPETLERPLSLHASTASEEAPLPADEEQPTALVAPDTLRRELERSRQSAEPVVLAQRSEPFELSDAARVAMLMASSIEKGRHELPTAPAAFPVVKLDAAIDPAPGAGRTVPIPKSTLAEVLGPRGPKGTARMVGAPDAAVPAPAPAPRVAEPHRPPRRRRRVALVLLIIVAAVVGAAVAVFVLGPSPR